MEPTSPNARATSAPKAEEEGALEPGTLIDSRYRITGFLGRGGMGSVYSAEHIKLGRNVAIKILNPELKAFPEVNERFNREALAAGRLSHPNCVRVSDCGTLEDGNTFMAMELLEGQSLAEELETSGRLEIPRAIRITRDLLRGLAHAHSVGVVHRDMKPENVFLMPTKDGGEVAKILDFGIAKLIGEALNEVGGNQLTQAGFAIGSPTYMSPEQAVSSAIDGRTDVYSTTILLYEMIAGRPPFVSDDDKLAVLRQHLSQPPPPLRSLCPDLEIPAGLEELLRHGLAKAPDDRIQSAHAFLKRLDHLESGATQKSERKAEGKKSRSSAAALAPTRPLLAPPTAEPARPAKQPARPAKQPARPAKQPGRPAKQPGRPAKQPGRPAKQKTLVFGGIGLLVAVAVLAAVLGGGDNAPPEEAPPGETVAASPPAEGEPSEPPEMELEADPVHAMVDLSNVRAMISAGRDRAAIKKLEGLRIKYKSDPNVHQLLGGLYCKRRWWSDCFASYRKAIRFDDSLKSDPAIINHAVRALSSKSNSSVARRFIADTLGATAIPALEKAATSKNDDTRRRARSLLARLKK